MPNLSAINELQMRALLQSCWNREASERPTITEVLLNLKSYKPRIELDLHEIEITQEIG